MARPWPFSFAGVGVILLLRAPPTPLVRAMFYACLWIAITNIPIAGSQALTYAGLTLIVL